MHFILAAVGLFALGLMCSEARAEKRVALVIGNGAYQNTGALTNPTNDAADLAAALQRLGFDVIEGRDLDKRDMERLIRQFGIKVAGADLALFYYAGHGIQIGGQNYLVPTDARLATEGDADFESIALSLVMKQMEREAKASLILLDACRDNPLARNLARAMSTRSTQVGTGLAEVRTAVGILIAFSTQPGYVALDGAGRNSPYAEALLKHIEVPGSDISAVLVDVRNDVLKSTAGKQVPWEHTSLTGQVYLKSAPGTTARIDTSKPGIDTEKIGIEPNKAPLTKDADYQLEIALWNSVKDSKSAAMFDAYLARYPTGTFAGLARIMAEELQGPAAKSTEQTRTSQPDPKILARSLQTQLKRVGCYSGSLDGLWGEKTKLALANFARYGKLQIFSDEPSTAALDAVATRADRVCPVECGEGTTEVDGKCQATPAKSGGSSASRTQKRSSSSSNSAQSYEPKSSITIGIGGRRGGGVGLGF